MAADRMMKLKIMMPLSVLLETDARKVSVKTVSGWWTFLPRHTDMVTLLLPGVLEYVDASDAVRYAALDEGVAVKQAMSLMMTVRHAVVGEQRDALEKVIAEQYRTVIAEEKDIREMTAKIEADFLRQFSEMTRAR
ncbi:MAG: hypothetical protein HZC28_10640 [Spirochaetes bacterium]|nr:hypothetical protein [Spirochaetota bacterium]